MKTKITFFIILFSFVLGYSQGNTLVKISNVKDVYEKIIEEISVFRFVNSKEGLGYDYVFDILSRKLSADATDINSILNSSAEFSGNYDINFKLLLNPDYLDILSNLFTDSEYFSIESPADKNLIENVLKDFTGKEYKLNNPEENIYTNTEIKEDFSFDSTGLIYGKTNNFLNQDKEWNFSFSALNKVLYGNFRTSEINFNKNTFLLKNLADRKIFGDYYTLENISRNDFLTYIEEFFVPFDKETEETLNELKNSIISENFVVSCSRELTKNTEISLFFFSAVDLEKVNRMAESRNLEKGKIGTYSYYNFSHKDKGVLTYIYFNSDEIILSTINPERMSVLLGESPRFKYSKIYALFEAYSDTKVNKVTAIDLEKYAEKKFYANLSTVISCVYYYSKDTFNVDMIVK